MSEEAGPPPVKKTNWLRMAIDYAAPLAFLAVWLIKRDYMLATWVLMGGSAVAVAAGLIFEKRLAPLPLVAGGFALVFGTLTLVFHDPRFIKMKMTFVDVSFGVFVLSGLFFKRMPLKSLLADTLVMPDVAWRTLSLRYGLFFLAVAAVNEVVWRTQSDERWAIWRIIALAAPFVFSLFQAPLLMKYMEDPSKVPPLPPIDPDVQA
jgi:intracellular septation protein